MTVRDTHLRLFRLILQHGSEEEKKEARDVMALMIQAHDEEPTLEWQPMEELRLPKVLIRKAKNVGTHRHGLARRYALQNRKGLGIRSLEEEIRVTEGQFACALMLGLPFGDQLTWTSAKKDGNLGQNCTAFVPKLGHVNLLIGEAEKRGRRVFLMLEQGDHYFRCAGWCRAGEFMIPEYQHTFTRVDDRGRKVESHPFMVPPDMLSPLETWWS